MWKLKKLGEMISEISFHLKYFNIDIYIIETI
jgi:hypothetical protein